MRWVKKKTQKTLSIFFVSVLIVQGLFAFAGVVRADEVDDGLYMGGGGRGTNDTIQANTQAAGAAAGTMSGTDTPQVGCGTMDLGCYIERATVWFLMQIRNFVYLFIGAPAAGAFIWVVNPANISGPTGTLNLPAVYSLWQFVRDFFNLFFILILLFSAFATIFQVDSFNIRNIFKGILLAALLINFSFPITRFLVDMVNVPMYYLINDVIGAGGGQGGVKAMNQLLGSSGIAAGTMAVETENSGIAQILMSIVFAFLFSISLFVLSALLIVRLLALVLLLIFSPIGFAASFLPGMSRFSSQWWGYFWKYALFGPASALMIVISLKFLQSSQNLFNSMRQVGVSQTTSVVDATSLAQVIYFTIPIILIWFTIGMANQFSIAGSSTVVGLGYGAANWTRRKLTGAALGAGKGVAKWGGRKVEKRLASSKYTRFLSPTAVMTAWKTRSEEQKHKDEAPVKQAAAAMQDTINRRISKVIRNPLKWNTDKGIDHTENTFAESQRQAHEQEKHITEVSDSADHVINESMHAIDNKQLDTLNGALLAMAKNNDLNDWIIRMGKEDRYKNLKDEKGNEMIDKDKEGNVVVSSKNARVLLAQSLRDAGEKDEELLAKRVMSISDRATASGNFAFGGMTVYDEKLNGHGGFRLATVRPEMVEAKNPDGSVKMENGKVVMEPLMVKAKNADGSVKTEDGKIVMEIKLIDEQAVWAAGKVKNLESQKRQTMLHPDSLFTRTKEGFGDINGEVAKEIIATFTGADAEQANRSRDDLKEAIHLAYQNELPEFMNQYKTNQNFQNYVHEVIKIKRGLPKGGATKDEVIFRDHPSGVKWSGMIPEPKSAGETVSSGGIVVPDSPKPRGGNR